MPQDKPRPGIMTPTAPKPASEVGSKTTFAMGKSADKKELIEEHERLVNVLESPSHEDDKEEAKRQGKELKDLKEGKEYKPVNKSFEDIENMTKALKAAHAAALAKRQAAEEAAAAAEAATPVASRENHRPIWEHKAPPVHRIPTPNPVTARPCGDHEYKRPVGGPAEAKPFHER